MGTLTLRPHWSQLCICQWWSLCLCLLTLAAAGVDGIHRYLRYVLLLLAALLALYVLYRMAELARMKYVITGEQLIFIHGIAVLNTDYMELYRVIDYRQTRTLAEQLLGLKTVTVLSGDRSMPQLHIIGVKEREDVVAVIRQRVEHNKKLKGIYEITNRL